MHNSKELLRILHSAGFRVVSTQGSHKKLKDGSGKTVTVPHGKSEFPKGTYFSILKQAGLKGKV